ncbi:glycoside hydrolase family 2 TIM barrel-domain containing protein [Lentisphaerota bacterium WC36G]|nr:glycoside hydrolase family 2 protein [Lentisphaerae bacterium WC36]
MKKGFRLSSLLLSSAFLTSIASYAAVPHSFSGTPESEIDTSSVKREFSTANFFALKNSPRKVYNFNVGWRFIKKDVPGASAVDFDDSKWNVVNTPHGLELLPLEASGGANYQGVAWYRKKFNVTKEMVDNKKLILYFESIMGKSEIYLNGKLIKKHYGGYLPISIDISEFVKAGAINIDDLNVVAVKADNSDDTEYPPGKTQKQLDFSYFGGIYRDVYLISHNKTYVSDAQTANIKAGGGVFVRNEIAKDCQSASVIAKTNIVNDTSEAKTVILKQSLYLKDDCKNAVATISKTVKLLANSNETVEQSLDLKNPKLWSPDSPYLYNLITEVVDVNNNEVVDSFRNRVGVRTIEIDPVKGLILNNKVFEQKLIGTNRHQDFAYIGNALPNSGQFRDAKKLRDAGARIVRSAHYPQDPAFMDAADELGIFVIVATPGWQFFNWKSKDNFTNLVISDIQQMIRRDRNYASVIMWEPILNETSYPADFAKTVYDTTHQEYPYKGCYAASDGHAKGNEYFDLIYAHGAIDKLKGKKATFTREWGDNVDDWSSHNSTSRVAIDWGETPQLIQAYHYMKPPYDWISFDKLHKNRPQHLGGTLWCGFDHNRGYHPDPFYGGIMDLFRRPKYSYFAFRSQVPATFTHPDSTVKRGPYVYIANELSPFSPTDLTVFSNCDEIEVSVFNKSLGRFKVKNNETGLNSLVTKIENVMKFMTIKGKHRGRKSAEANVTIKGFVNGKEVIVDSRLPSTRAARLVLIPDFSGTPLLADGSDIVTVVAYLVDKNNQIKRLNDSEVKFTVTGEGQVLGDASIAANPRRLEWGSAPALIRATTKPGDITIKAEIISKGTHVPQSAELTIKSTNADQNFVYSEVAPLPVVDISQAEAQEMSSDAKKEIKKLQKKLQKTEAELNSLKLKEVERQQTEFEKSTTIQKQK